MATGKDPNKTLLEEQATVDANQRTKAGQTATVTDGQVIDGFVLTVAGGVVTAIEAEDP